MQNAIARENTGIIMCIQKHGYIIIIMHTQHMHAHLLMHACIITIMHTHKTTYTYTPVGSRVVVNCSAEKYNVKFTVDN